MKKQLWGLFCAAVLAATLALPVRAAEQTHRAYLCGYPDGTIRPNARITRAQLACALVRLAEEPLPEPTRVTFFDVPGDHWACTQIRQLAGLGLLPFGEGGWFLPSATVSWRELCSVLDTLAGYYVEGGGFRHLANGKLDGMATEQAFYALAAIHRAETGKTTLYDMTDVMQ